MPRPHDQAHDDDLIARFHTCLAALEGCDPSDQRDIVEALAWRLRMTTRRDFDWGASALSSAGGDTGITIGPPAT